MFSVLVANYYVYLTTHLGNEAFWLLLPYWYEHFIELVAAVTCYNLGTILLRKISRLPFDWKSPIGYFIAFIMICPIALVFVTLGVYYFTYGIGFYILITSFVEDIKNDLSAFSEMVQLKRNQQKLTKHFFEAIQFQSKVKRFKFN